MYKLKKGIKKVKLSKEKASSSPGICLFGICGLLTTIITLLIGKDKFQENNIIAVMIVGLLIYYFILGLWYLCSWIAFCLFEYTYITFTDGKLEIHRLIGKNEVLNAEDYTELKVIDVGEIRNEFGFLPIEVTNALVGKYSRSVKILIIEHKQELDVPKLEEITEENEALNENFKVIIDDILNKIKTNKKDLYFIRNKAKYFEVLEANKE